jgi:hypothetical protein
LLLKANPLFQALCFQTLTPSRSLPFSPMIWISVNSPSNAFFHFPLDHAHYAEARDPTALLATDPSFSPHASPEYPAFHPL